MATIPHTSTSEIVSLTGSEAELKTLAHALLLYHSNIVRVLEEAGFSRITAVATDYEDKPQFTAFRNGKAACICFAALCSYVLDVPHLSQAQCDACDSLYPQYDVYYACLYYQGEDDDRKLMLLGPEILKRDGKWIDDELQHSQYLPINRRDSVDRYSAIYNGAVLFKLLQVLFPAITARWDAPTFTVDHLFADAEQGATDYLALRLFRTPTVACILRADPELQKYAFVRSLFLHCSGPTSELELVSMLQGDEELDARVVLMDATGHELLAECAETLLYRPHMQTGCRYMWHLSMVAEHLHPMEREFSITSGPLYEIHCREYREEHGCEPPADFAMRLSTSGMRSCMQEDDDTYCSATGQVLSVTLETVDNQPMLILTLRPVADNDDVQLQVFVSPEVLDDYAPQAGDTVCAAGYLYAAADSLLQDAPSWQDSVEVGELMQERELEAQAHHVYNELSRYSMGHAVAAAAFVRAGWELTSCDKNWMYDRNHPLWVTAQDGSKAVVCVDVVVNGHASQAPYSDVEDIHNTVKQAYGEDVACYCCTVTLDYHDEMERYAISMHVEPECPGVCNTLIYAACAFQETILSFDDDGPAQQQRLRPEHLDEAMAASLFKDAMASGKWAAFAEWVREELDYVSESTNGCHLVGKLAFLRYICERIGAWKFASEYGPAWKDFSFTTGTVLYRGARRACAAMYYRGIPSAVTIFEDAQGLIGGMHNLPWDLFCTFIRDETVPAVNLSLAADAEPEMERSVVRPPHETCAACTSAPAAPVALRLAAQRVIDFLLATRCTPVYCSLAAGEVPHIWFRDAQERLCWVVLCDSSLDEKLGNGVLELHHAIPLKKLRHYPGFLVAAIQEPCEPVSLVPANWNAWENL